MIGLGKMGSNMVKRLLKGGHRIFTYDPVPGAVQNAARDGALTASSIEDLVSKLSIPRAVWVMVPSGDATEGVVTRLAAELSQGDTIIDGGNSNYKDSVRRAKTLAQKGIFLLDVGTSGGIWGLNEGFCLMIGGETKAFKRLEPVFQTLATSPSKGYGHVGPTGAGHFVKMIHNGIEYGLMEAYAEGFELLQAKSEFKLNMLQIAWIWRYSSVIRSWLLELTADALEKDPELSGIQAYVEDSGEGRWVVNESIELAVPAPVIAIALQMRFRSRQSQPFGAKLLAALRHQFGGHIVRR